jgi:prefoldin subunit 5
MKRPECYEFGMEFMGDPEETEIRAYVEWLEKRIEELEAAQQSVQLTAAGVESAGESSNSGGN